MKRNVKQTVDHIDEKTLELHVLKAGAVKGRRADIERHLRRCPGCSALAEEISAYYQDVRKVQDERQNEPQHAITLRSMALRVPYDAPGPLQSGHATLPARAVLFVIRHYVAASLGLFALIIAGLMLLLPRTSVADKNPSYVRAKDECMVVYNLHGDEVWRKHIGPHFEEPEVDVTYRTATVDLDGDGKNEVIAAFGGLSPRLKSLDNVVKCFDSYGRDRWQYQFAPKTAFGKSSFPADFQFTTIKAGDFARNGRMQIAAIGSNIPNWPAALVLLDAKSGKQISEYWHAGWFTLIVESADIDGDGIEELLLTGENNSFGKASLVVLDPRKAEGHSPATPDYTPVGVGEGYEKYYLLFPSPDLQAFASRSTCWGGAIDVKQDGSLEVRAQVVLDPWRYDIIYYFDKTMKCVKVQVGDEYAQMHRRLEAEGKLKNRIDDRYLEKLRRGILYWDGKKFVSEPTMNGLYKSYTRAGSLP